MIFAASVTLMWFPNPEPIAGYRLQVRGPVPYLQTVDVGKATQTTVSGLTQGTTYNFGLTAYNTVGIESLMSPEIAYALPLAPLPTPSPTPMPAGVITVLPTSITFNGVVGGPSPVRQSIQVTTANGANWTSADTSPWFNTSDTNTKNGVSGASCILTPHTTGMVAGTYTENITFSAQGLPDTKVLVTLKLTPKSSPTPTATPRPTATPKPSPTPTCTPCPCLR